MKRQLHGCFRVAGTHYILLLFATLTPFQPVILPINTISGTFLQESELTIRIHIENIFLPPQVSYLENGEAYHSDIFSSRDKIRIFSRSFVRLSTPVSPVIISLAPANLLISTLHVYIFSDTLYFKRF